MSTSPTIEILRQRASYCEIFDASPSRQQFLRPAQAKNFTSWSSSQMTAADSFSSLAITARLP
jgi:hypothetical protein